MVGSVRPEPTPRTDEPRERRPFTLARAVSGGLLLVTTLVVLFGCYLVVGAGLAADRTQSVMYGQLRKDLTAATVPVSGTIAPGTPLGVVRVPSIGLDQVFVEGSSSEQTRSGPGLVTSSVLPGQTGVSLLVGHRSVSGAAFAHLDDVQPGDPIQVVTGQGTFSYLVDMVRTSDAPAVKVQAAASRLTLVTSDPAYAPNRKLMVSAVLQGKALPRSTGTSAPSSDQPSHGSTRRPGRAAPLEPAAPGRHLPRHLGGPAHAVPPRAVDRCAARAAGDPLAGLRQPRRPPAQHPVTT